MKTHERLARRKLFRFGFQTPRQEEEYCHAEWRRLFNSKKWKGRIRVPALYLTCSECKVERPCFLNERTLCFNCAIIKGLRVRRAFDHKDHLKIVAVGGGSMHAWKRGDVVVDPDLPTGKYFFHCTPKENLSSIRAHGLQSKKEFVRWTVQEESKPMAGESRLFLYPSSAHCFHNMDFGADSSSKVSLRFRRRLLNGVQKIWDDGYGGGVFSFFVRSVIVSASELEFCDSTRWSEYRSERVATKWRRLAL